MFPGQGSQAVGMGRDLFATQAIVRETYEEASAALGYDIAALSFEGPAERLGQTDVTAGGDAGELGGRLPPARRAGVALRRGARPQPG